MAKDETERKIKSVNIDISDALDVATLAELTPHILLIIQNKLAERREYFGPDESNRKYDTKLENIVLSHSTGYVYDENASFEAIISYPETDDEYETRMDTLKKIDDLRKKNKMKSIEKERRLYARLHKKYGKEKKGA